MRRFYTPAFVAFIILTGTLMGCENAQWNPSDEEMCKDYYELTPGSWDYNYCVENMGKPFTFPSHE